MKKSIIGEIFLGRRGFCETIKESKEYKEAKQKATNLIKELEKNLDKKQKSLLENLTLLTIEAEAQAATTHFTEGIKLGILIGLECQD